MGKELKVSGRNAKHPINSLILHRWSPRALSEKPVTHEELMALFEAARWAPSSYNNQPWRFVYAYRNTPEWNNLFHLLVDFNQSWADKAGVLVVIISKKTFDFNGKPSRTHSFDTGASWQNLALQAFDMGLVAHGLEGFDYDQAKQVLGIPEGYQVEAMCAIGHHGKKEDLSEELQVREIPSDRKPLAEIAFEGRFKDDKE